ncbi:MAG: sensor histidine kinase [Clostridiaceae bacterium]|nr:sensor histidine kinase [Clostridiaceae bacterium]
MLGLWYNKVNICLNILRKKYSDLKISVKFALFYFIILVVSMTLSNIIYQKIYSSITIKKVSSVSVQTLYSIKTSLNMMINNINSYSKMILSDSDLQYLLRNGNIYYDLNAQGRVSTYLYKLIQEVPDISSVHIFDFSGNEFSVSYKDIYKFTPQKLQEAEWYEEVVDNSGAYILKLNGGGAFSNYHDKNFVSMIRLIRDINTTESIGVLIINISETAFIDSYYNITNNYTTGISIFDENNNSIIKTNVIEGIKIDSLISENGDEESGISSETINNDKYLVSYLRDDRLNWKIGSIMPVSELSNETNGTGFVGYAIIMINSFILFIGSVFTSRMITIPIKKLLKSMKNVEKGVFTEVDIKTGDNEIGRLRDGYNIMIREIRNLFDKIIEEQRIKRIAELNMLQAQIKPHFLYNTLDSINSLALSGRTEDVSSLIEALGSYYRTSLSKGNEVITIREEILMVKNYIKIQQVRFGDSFSEHYDLDESCSNCKILKLVLQPLVENAINHGIIAKQIKGNITIMTRRMEERILIVVEDDGAGIPEEKLSDIMKGGNSSAISGFGLKCTIDRVKIYYGMDYSFDIDSKEGLGTRITINIPAFEESEELQLG